MIVAVDSHMHGDILIQKDKNFPTLYYEKKISGIIWSYNEEIKKIEDYIDYWNFLKNVTYKISNNSCPFFYKIGIHPRTICEELKEKRSFPDKIKKALEQHLKDKRCLGIGEIGLETEDKTEEEIFISHLKWCENYLPYDKRIGIHTPRKNKKAITKKIIDILSNFKSLLFQVIIDHVELNTIDLVKELNTYIGMTLQIGKSKGSDIKKLVSDDLYPVDKILLNSDSAREISTPYIDFIKNDLLEKNIKEKLIKENAIQFYDIKI